MSTSEAKQTHAYDPEGHNTGEHALSVRAADDTATMPRSLAETWNVKGYGNNAWHRVPVTVRQ